MTDRPEASDRADEASVTSRELYQRGWDAGQAALLAFQDDDAMTDRPDVLREAAQKVVDTWGVEGMAAAVDELEVALATPDPAPSSEGGLDVERVMDAEHRWCVQVDGEWALKHGVEGHRKQAEFVIARLSMEEV